MNATTDSRQRKGTRVSLSWRRTKSWVGRFRQIGNLPIIVLLLLFAYVLSMWLTFLVPDRHSDKSIALDPEVPVWLSVTYPKYIAIGDEGYIDVTIRNESDRTISSTVVVDFTDDHILRLYSPGTNKMEFKDFVPREMRTSRIGFVLDEAPFFSSLAQSLPPVSFDVIVMDASGKRASALSGQTIGIAPLPYLRTALPSFGILSGVLALLLVLPTDWLSKRLLGERRTRH